MLLAGDIGGTKSVLALFSDELGPHHCIEKARYVCADYDSLAAIVADFLGRHDVQPTTACFGVAGPVQDNKVQVTNLPWQIDGRALSSALNGIPVYLLNDLEAIANAIPILESEDVVVLKPGEVDPEGPIAVVAPGTGLGEAFLFWDGQRYRAVPSEGGHTDFAPATPLELELLSYLQPRMSHVSYERVCSGIGMPNLYAFLHDSGRYEEPAWLAAELAKVDDPTPVIVKAAQAGRAPICEATLELFLAILGSEAGNMVLQILATGGVYLGGGIPPRILPQLQGDAFLRAFTRKGRFSDLLGRVQVEVIVDPRSALHGAANFGLLMSAAASK
ncbi:MAG: glucokinase [Chloroflexota bacterium]|nr:MAG: glucokinase [Chloroflexota bacterium]